MQKIKGIVCYSVAALLAVLNLAWYALDYAVAKYAGAKAGYGSVYDLFKLNGLTGDAKTSEVFAIITLVLACLLAVGCVIGLLNELGVLKLSVIKYVNYALAALTVVSSVVALALMASAIKDVPYSSVGEGLILPLVFSVVSLAAVVVATLNFKKKA